MIGLYPSDRDQQNKGPWYKQVFRKRKEKGKIRLLGVLAHPVLDHPGYIARTVRTASAGISGNCLHGLYRAL